MAECPGGEGTLMWSPSVDVPFGTPLGSGHHEGRRVLVPGFPVSLGLG